MITVEEARHILAQVARPTSVVLRELAEASGHHLAQHVVAPHDHPLFDMSAVDGYAFAFEEGRSTWRQVASLAAGDVHGAVLGAGECARIFTGAMIPTGADTVVMQEFVERDGDHITHHDTKLRSGGNVRRKGEQLRVGDVLLKPGTVLGPAEIGLLASAGVGSVAVHRKPLVNVVRTGGEFATGAETVPGRIFSSNDVMLVSALMQEGMRTAAPVFTPKDEAGELRRSLAQAAQGCDVLITTGGVSVGDHDLVKSVLLELGAEVLFHGVHQKPGKPMLFARLGNTFVFGLPGNPRAVLVAWYLFVRPFLLAVQGATGPVLRSESLPLSAGITLKGARAEFRAASVRAGVVHLLADEGSHMLSSLIAANAIVYFPATVRRAEAGELTEVYYLPGR